MEGRWEARGRSHREGGSHGERETIRRRRREGTVEEWRGRGD